MHLDSGQIASFQPPSLLQSSLIWTLMDAKPRTDGILPKGGLGGNLEKLADPDLEFWSMSTHQLDLLCYSIVQCAHCIMGYYRERHESENNNRTWSSIRC